MPAYIIGTNSAQGKALRVLHCGDRMAWGNTSRHARGYGYQWTKTRARILARDMHLCQACLAKGRPTPATEVDHITPKAKGGTDDDDNLAAICAEHHLEKTIGEAIEGRGGKRRHKIGADGWPIE